MSSHQWEAPEQFLLVLSMLSAYSVICWYVAVPITRFQFDVPSGSFLYMLTGRDMHATLEACLISCTYTYTLYTCAYTLTHINAHYTHVHTLYTYTCTLYTYMHSIHIYALYTHTYTLYTHTCTLYTCTYTLYTYMHSIHIHTLYIHIHTLKIKEDDIVRVQVHLAGTTSQCKQIPGAGLGTYRRTDQGSQLMGVGT